MEGVECKVLAIEQLDERVQHYWDNPDEFGGVQDLLRKFNDLGIEARSLILIGRLPLLGGYLEFRANNVNRLEDDRLFFRHSTEALSDALYKAIVDREAWNVIERLVVAVLRSNQRDRGRLDDARIQHPARDVYSGLLSKFE